MIYECMNCNIDWNVSKDEAFDGTGADCYGCGVDMCPECWNTCDDCKDRFCDDCMVFDSDCVLDGGSRCKKCHAEALKKFKEAEHVGSI